MAALFPVAAAEDFARHIAGILGLLRLVARVSAAGGAAALARATERFADGGAGRARLEVVGHIAAGDEKTALGLVADVAEEIAQADDPHAAFAGRVFEFFLEAVDFDDRLDFIGIGRVGNFGDLADDDELGLFADLGFVGIRRPAVDG